MKFLGEWLELENIILSEVTQSQKNTHGMQSLISSSEYPRYNSHIKSFPRRWKERILVLERLDIALQGSTRTEKQEGVDRRMGSRRGLKELKGRGEPEKENHFECKQRKDSPACNKDICSIMFIAALFIIARSWKEPRCPSKEEWIQNMRRPVSGQSDIAFWKTEYNCPNLDHCLLLILYL